MIFNKHSKLQGLHAFLSPSNYHWISYDEDKLIQRYLVHAAAQRGTELHEFANHAIRLGIKLPKTSATLNMYVNDAIGYRMVPEQTLFYSENCFGTADAISFRKDLLRIHDLKTGLVPASFHQLEVYAALFCLEYHFKPFAIKMELRIYQNDDVQVLEGDPDAITHIMEQIKLFDKRIFEIRNEGVL